VVKIVKTGVLPAHKTGVAVIEVPVIEASINERIEFIM